MSTLSQTGYMVVRKSEDDGREFFQHNSFSADMQNSRLAGRMVDSNMRGYASDNPVVRVACVMISELPDITELPVNIPLGVQP